MTSDFDSLMDSADEELEAVMGEPVMVYHGETGSLVQALVERSADSVRPKHTRIVRFKTHTVTLELRQSQLPDVKYTELEADVDGVRYHVVDDDVDNGWALLALAVKSETSTTTGDTNFFNHD